MTTQDDATRTTDEATTTHSGPTTGAKEKKMNKKQTRIAKREEKATKAQEPAVVVTPKPSPVAPRPEPRVGNVIKPQYRPGFVAVPGLKTASGSPVLATSNDVVVHLLAGKDTDGLKAIADEYGVIWKWDHLNPGMQRMNLGNRLRALVRAGTIEIG